VLPNGIDLTEFVAATTAPQPGTILFTGLMSYYPNQQAVRWFLNEVFPVILKNRPDARLVVAGAAPPRWMTALARPEVEVTGLVPDIRPYLERAAVFIAPLMIGGGTRVKILEALAMERPVVSTSIGAEGLELAHGASVLFADDPAAFAARVVDVLQDARLAARLGTCGRQHVAARFDWDRIGEAARQLLASRIGLEGRAGAARGLRPFRVADRVES